MYDIFKEQIIELQKYRKFGKIDDKACRDVALIENICSFNMSKKQ